MNELDTKYTIVAYERHDNGEEPPTYEFVSCWVRSLDHENYERKLYRALSLAISAINDASDGACVVAYLRADGADEDEGCSYAVIALEQEPGRGATFWTGDEIAEQIQLW